MRVVSVTLVGPTLDRLAALAAAYDVTPDVMLSRLLDRDPHDHEHRCPTCVRGEERHRERLAADEQPDLFSVG